jgi:hypothetical protein
MNQNNINLTNTNTIPAYTYTIITVLLKSNTLNVPDVNILVPFKLIS